jgi:hypothetical protein
VDDRTLVADLGTAVHELLADHVRGRPLSLRPVEVAQRYRVAEGDVVRLFDRAVALWQTRVDMYPNVQTEVPLTYSDDGVEMSGTADLLSISPDRVAIADLKTGRIRGDYLDQVYGYAFMALAVVAAPEVLVEILWAHFGEIDSHLLAAGDVAQWWEGYRTRLLNGRGAYAPGKHCQYCRKRRTCPGHRQTLERAIVAAEDGSLALTTLTPASAAEVGPQIASMLGALAVADRYRDALEAIVRAYIDEHGPLEAGDGRILKYGKPRRRRVVDAQKGWPIVKSALGGDEDALARCVSMSTTAIEREVKARAPRREKAATAAAVFHELELSDALSFSESRPPLQEAPDDREPVSEERREGGLDRVGDPIDGDGLAEV